MLNDIQLEADNLQAQLNAQKPDLPSYNIMEKSRYGIGSRSLLCRVSIPDKIPTIPEIKAIAEQIHRYETDYTEELTIFFYVLDMPTTSASYAKVEATKQGSLKITPMEQN